MKICKWGIQFRLSWRTRRQIYEEVAKIAFTCFLNSCNQQFAICTHSKCVMFVGETYIIFTHSSMTIILRGIFAGMTACVCDLLHIWCHDMPVQVTTDRQVCWLTLASSLSVPAWQRYEWCVLAAARILGQSVIVLLKASQVLCSIN